MKEEIKKLQSKILKEYEDNPRAYHTDTFEKWLCEKIEQTYKQCGENILEELIKIENERWEDAKHCTCLGYAIIQVAGGDDGDIDELERRLKLMHNKQ
jgi:hypothetical protein